MIKTEELYPKQENPVNELKGFTKSFQKRTKDKREEDKEIIELLNLQKVEKLNFGRKTTIKLFKADKIEKVFVAKNCDEFTLSILNYYSKLSKVEIIILNLDNLEISQKLGKPFLISIIGVKIN